MKPRSLSTSFFRRMALLSGILCLGLGFAWVGHTYTHLKADMRKTENQHVALRKADVKALVTNLVQGIEYQIDTAEVDLENILKHRVDRAVAVAQHLYELNRDKLSDDEILALLRESIRPLRFDNDSGYFFMLKTDGISVLNADRPEFEGADMLGVQEPDGTYIIPGLLKVIREKGEGPYTYRWTKPGETGHDHQKTSYVKLFEPLDLVIGTGQYFEDFIALQQESILRRVRQIAFPNDGYVFVNTYDGVALIIRSDRYKAGDNVWEITDPNGLKVVQEERRAVQNPEGDFIYYTWLEPGTQNSVEKISFMKGIDRWQWMFGAGVYLSDLQAEITHQKQAMGRTIFLVVLQIVVAFICAFLLALYFARRHSRRIEAELENMGTVFQDAVLHHSPIDTTRIGYLEFRGFADSMNKMISEREKIEGELLKVRNLESIGVLAGGIAHDFNNLLTAILGNISLAREEVPVGGFADESLEQAELVSFRARDLTGQLLAFAKGGAPILSLENVGNIIRDSAGFSLRGSSVQLNLTLPDDLWPAQVDTGQFSQVISNLVINASHAMPDGGTIDITAHNVVLGERNDSALSAGDYIAIEFVDTGIGIQPHDLSRVFDPYFTTKTHGSGLGLASVYAIVNNHKGLITVKSKVDQGTEFQVWIPAKKGDQVLDKVTKKGSELFNARVLLMDDDPDVGRAGTKMLERLGCNVDFVTDGREILPAYTKALKDNNKFDLVVMDLTNRGGMGGQEAVGLLLESYPDAVALVSSGYFNNPVLARCQDYGFKAVIRKPYSMDELRTGLGKVLTSFQ